MEPKKDNNLSDTNNSLLNKGFLDVLLKDDPELLYILKKSEKIVAAVYLITASLDEREPLRYSIREIAMSFIGHLLLLKEPAYQADRNFIVTLEGMIADLVSYFELGVLSSLISPMNADLIKKQLGLITGMIDKPYNGGDKRIMLPAGFFEGDEHLLRQPQPETQEFQIPKMSQEIPEAPQYKGQTKGQESVFYKPVSDMSLKPAVKKDSKDRSFIKGDRKEKIINLLKNRSNLTINDFTKVIKDCSEKTIQRELILMVSQGILTKKGERRWSTYSLA